jgi:hypothetical protein
VLLVILLSGALEMPSERTPIICAKFLENFMQMLFYCSVAQSQIARNLLIRQATRNETRDFALARGQLFVPRSTSCHVDGANQSIHSKSRTLWSCKATLMPQG